MEKEIKILRVTIDGISQLVKSLHPVKYIVNIAAIPPGKTTKEFIEDFKSNNPAMVQNNMDAPAIREIKSPELEKCYDCLILAKAWLGKILGELGNPSPYANDGKRTDVNSIEPTADTYKEITIGEAKKQTDNFNYLDFNHIQKVDHLRQEIQKVIPQIEILWTDVNTSHIHLYSEFCIKELSEARFWLGFELQRIKELADGKAK